MHKDVAEIQVRQLQKEFLVGIENHPAFHVMSPASFNTLRKRVFRGTFEAYRLGIIGPERTEHLFSFFVGWLSGLDTGLDPAMHHEIAEMCLRTSLSAYRIGAMVAASREE
jgi:hypothetical protein